MLNWEKHPIKVVESIIDRYGDEIIFEFSRYKYIPQSLKDTREIFTVNANVLSQEYVDALISNLREGEELALHSRIIMGDEVKHIPMIDLSAKSTARAVKALVKLLPKDISEELVFYNSGRSFHVYSTILMNTNDFPSFLGRLLLSNNPGEPLLVDSRWVGHRLVGGYLSLRWSCNSSSYIQYPQKVKNI